MHGVKENEELEAEEGKGIRGMRWLVLASCMFFFCMLAGCLFPRVISQFLIRLGLSALWGSRQYDCGATAHGDCAPSLENCSIVIRVTRLCW